MRLQYKRGQISEVQYREAIAAEIGYSIGIQEAIGMDVFVHGEAERSDMVRNILDHSNLCISCYINRFTQVEYFGLRLDGFAFTDHGYVDEYHSFLLSKSCF